jgi:hypothetical protein
MYTWESFRKSDGMAWCIEFQNDSNSSVSCVVHDCLNFLGFVCQIRVIRTLKHNQFYRPTFYRFKTTSNALLLNIIYTIEYSFDKIIYSNSNTSKNNLMTSLISGSFFTEQLNARRKLNDLDYHPTDPLFQPTSYGRKIKRTRTLGLI